MLQRVNGPRVPESSVEEESDNGHDSPTSDDNVLPVNFKSRYSMVQKRKRRHDSLDIREQESVALRLIDSQRLK